jgi:diguanylate cyclase (GGDEF)-like protein
VGDKVIAAAAKAISDVFKRSPVFRIGGDEFLAVLQYRDLEDCEELLKRLDAICANTFIKETGNTPISIASGFAMFEADRDRCLNDVFKRADKAMYKNKRKIKEGTV